MQAERTRAGAETPEQFWVPRALPRARFVEDLDQDIRRAAREQMEKAGIRPSMPFEEMVIELRKLVRLLRKTLVPICPRAEFTRALGQQLEMQSVIVIGAHEQQRRWLMVGGMVGSVLSVAGVLTALALRRRNGHSNGHSQVDVKKPAGVA